MTKPSSTDIDLYGEHGRRGKDKPAARRTYAKSWCLLGEAAGLPNSGGTGGVGEALTSSVSGKGDLNYRLLFEASAQGVLLAAPDGTIFDANRAACRTLQRTRDEVIAAGLDALFDPSDPRLEHAREEQRRTGRFGGEIRLLRQDGVSFLAEVSIVSYQDHDGEGAIGVLFQHITERKRTEEKRREGEERYRRLVKLTPEIVAVHSAAPEGKWVCMNAAGARLFGAARPEELIGTRVMDRIHPDYREFIKGRWRRTQVERKPTELAEIKMVRLDGEIIDVETRGIPATYEGRPATQVSIVDITERVEEEIRRLDDVLESRVAERTAQLEATVSKLEANERMLREREADLQRSRERLVTAREEERQRLRRDLHDGLGPQLASLTMRAEAAHDLVPLDPTRAQEVLEGLAEQAQAAVADVRRLVYALRPPALDALGLMGALRSQAAHHHDGLRIIVDGPEEMPTLPAAVEVAAYRIALEALTNVGRHAQARTCTVRLGMDEKPSALRLEVQDDGRGIEDDRRAGVGLASMRERAEELGGTCTVEPLPSGGTRVRAFLPCLRDHVMGSGAGQPSLKGA